MKIVSSIIIFGFCFLSIILLTEFSNSSEPISRIYVENPTGKPGIQEMRLNVISIKKCDSLNVSFSMSDNLILYGSRELVIEVSANGEKDIYFQVDIPASDTSVINIDIEGCGNFGIPSYTFLASEDTVLYHSGLLRRQSLIQPSFAVDSKGCSTKIEINPTDHSKEDSVVYKFVIDLREPKVYSNFKNNLQKYFVQIVSLEKDGFYILRTTKYELYRLKGAGIEGRIYFPEKIEEIYNSFDKIR